MGLTNPSGVCRFCGCTEENACTLQMWPTPIGVGMKTCSWADEAKTICTNPKCLAKATCANPHCGHSWSNHFEGGDCMRCRCSRFRAPAKRKAA